MGKRITESQKLADAIQRRRTARAFRNLEQAAEQQRPSKHDGHPSREPDPQPWGKPESLDRR